VDDSLRRGEGPSLAETERRERSRNIGAMRRKSRGDGESKLLGEGRTSFGEIHASPL
jgi:hypothetical protein